MARKPFTVSKFGGVDNRHAPEALVSYAERARGASTFLTEAINVDLSDGGRLSRRDGFSLHTAGDCHSLWWNGALGFLVKNQRLGLIDEDLTFTDLREASERFVSYADAGEAGIYISDGQFMARYRGGSLTTLAKAGTYAPNSSYLDPSEDAVIYDYPPAGHLLMWMFGRLWVANDEAVYYSRGYMPDRFRLNTDYINEQNVTLLAPVADGYYLGTEEKVVFVDNPNPNANAAVTTVCNYGAVSRTQIVTQAERFGLDGAVGKAVVWDSPRGKIIGLAGGRIKELTDRRVSYPVGEHGAAMLRELNGETHHVSSIAVRDSDTSNMRTTDTAVAEVVRNGITV